MIYEEKNSLSKEVCNDMISWFDNKLISGKVGINYVNASDEIRKDESITSCNNFKSFESFYT